MRSARLTDRARTMRKRMTEPETRLWLQLRAGRFGGVKFRRQKVIGPYIADFASNNPKLVIEVDGDSHGDNERYDTARTAAMNEMGYRVVRYTNEDVMLNLEGLLMQLAELIEEMGHAPLPTLSPQGERAS